MDPFSFLTLIQSTLGNLNSISGNLFSELTSVISNSFFLQIIAIVIIIGKCIFLAINFAVKAFLWFFTGFIPWIFTPWPTPNGKPNGNIFKPEKNDTRVEVGFIPYIIRYIIVIIYSIANLPKCIMWYALDTLGWIIYMPFRVAFWTLDLFLGTKIVEYEHDTWDFFNEIDYFLHGPMHNWFSYQYADFPNPNIPDPNSMNLGFHIIHFPNSVMEKCYSTLPYKLARCGNVKEVFDAFTAFIECATSPF